MSSEVSPTTCPQRANFFEIHFRLSFSAGEYFHHLNRMYAMQMPVWRMIVEWQASQIGLRISELHWQVADPSCETTIVLKFCDIYPSMHRVRGVYSLCVPQTHRHCHEHLT